MAKVQQDRRRESRALTAALVELTDEYEDKTTCVLEDLSPYGASVHSDIAFTMGSTLKLRVGRLVHNGSVRHCKPVDGGFSVGIQFQGEWPGSIGFPVHWIRPER